jgi:hypothetical protein
MFTLSGVDVVSGSSRGVPAVDTQAIIKNLRAVAGLSEAVGDLLILRRDATVEERLVAMHGLYPKILPIISEIPNVSGFLISDNNERLDWQILLLDQDAEVVATIPIRALVTFH